MLTRQTIPILLFGIVLCLVLLKHKTVEQKCDNFLNYGRWASDYDSTNSNLPWHPYDSVIQSYDGALISRCLANRTLYFAGDSIARKVFWAVAAKHDRHKAGEESASAGKHEDILYAHGKISLSFIWDPYLNSSQVKRLLTSPNTLHPRDANDTLKRLPVAGIIASTGLWHVRYGGAEFAEQHRQALNVVARYTHKKSLHSDATVSDAYLILTPSILLPPPTPNYELLRSDRAATLTPERMGNITENLLAFQDSLALEIAWSTRAMTSNIFAAVMPEGLHVTEGIAMHQAEVVLNRVCNNVLFSRTKKASSLPCVRQDATVLTWKFCLIILPISIIIAYLFAARWSQKSTGRFLQATSILLATLTYCWLADRTIAFDKVNKLVDVKMFCLCTAVIMMFSLVRRRTGVHTNMASLPCSKTGGAGQVEKVIFLPREITEEWKGWMQIFILAYHYFGMSKTLPVYQIVRVLVASYLFLTGYGHASYFLIKGDFSLQRVFKVILRLNLLTCLLAITMDNTHEFYYFPSLATVWFIMTYAVFWRAAKPKRSAKQMVARILAALCLCQIFIQSESSVSHMFRSLQQICGPEIDAREFLFRFRLDVLAPFAGMLLAVVEDNWSGRYLQIWKRLMCNRSSSTVKIIMTVVCVTLLFSYACIAGHFSSKQDYNRWHSPLSLIPITAYIILRKLLWDENHLFAPTLVWIGSTSLELFVLQYHVWLAADTKALLRFGLVDVPGMSLGTTVKGSWTYWIEAVIVTIIFVWVSLYCSWATNHFVQWFCDPGEGSNDQRQKALLIRLVLTILWLWLTNYVSPPAH